MGTCRGSCRICILCRRKGPRQADGHAHGPQRRRTEVQQKLAESHQAWPGGRLELRAALTLFPVLPVAHFPWHKTRPPCRYIPFRTLASDSTWRSGKAPAQALSCCLRSGRAASPPGTPPCWKPWPRRAVRSLPPVSKDWPHLSPQSRNSACERGACPRLWRLSPNQA